MNDSWKSRLQVCLKTKLVFVKMSLLGFMKSFANPLF